MIIIVTQNDLQNHLIINQQKTGANAHIRDFFPLRGAARDGC